MNHGGIYRLSSGLKITLRVAAIYNILAGIITIFFPLVYFETHDLPIPTYPVIWQGLAMVIGLYGLAYFWASYDYIKFWPIVAIGLLGKIFGPIGFVWFYLQGQIPGEFGYMLILNDLVWWIPFTMMIVHAKREGFPL